MFERSNGLHNNLKFTMEREADSSLAFLDFRIHRSTDGSLNTEWFHKPTDTDLCLNFWSLAPFRYKASVVAGMIYRVYRSCSSWELISRNIDKAKQILERNQYPQQSIIPSLDKQFQRLFLAKNRAILMVVKNVGAVFLCSSWSTEVMLLRSSSSPYFLLSTKCHYKLFWPLRNCVHFCLHWKAELTSSTEAEWCIKLHVRGVMPYMSDKLFVISPPVSRSMVDYLHQWASILMNADNAAVAGQETSKFLILHALCLLCLLSKPYTYESLNRPSTTGTSSNRKNFCSKSRDIVSVLVAGLSCWRWTALCFYDLYFVMECSIFTMFLYFEFFVLVFYVSLFFRWCLMLMMQVNCEMHP